MCKYIPANASNEHFSYSCDHFISFQAVKQCDTTLFMSGHTKKTVRKVSEGNPGIHVDVGAGIMTEDALSSVEEFICRLYGVTQTRSVDASRHILFPGEESQKIFHQQGCLVIPCKKVSLPGDDLARCALLYTSITFTCWPGMEARRRRFTAHTHFTLHTLLML